MKMFFSNLIKSVKTILYEFKSLRSISRIRLKKMHQEEEINIYKSHWIINNKTMKKV